MSEKANLLPSLPKGAVQLLLTAERLFGEQGIDGVSLRQIVSAAGQANSSAVHHHFGSKEGLVQAVYDMRLPELDSNRMALLERFKDDDGHVPLSELLKVMFLPVVDNMDEVAQKSFALFHSQLMLLDISNHPFSHSQIPQPAYDEIYRRLTAALSYLPPAVIQLRLRLATDLFFGALNERRRLKIADKSLYPSEKPYWNEVFLAIEALLRLPYTDVGHL
jgi:AcrR family transcriptional regulator